MARIAVQLVARAHSPLDNGGSTDEIVVGSDLSHDPQARTEEKTTKPPPKRRRSSESPRTGTVKRKQAQSRSASLEDAQDSGSGSPRSSTLSPERHLPKRGRSAVTPAKDAKDGAAEPKRRGRAKKQPPARRNIETTKGASLKAKKDLDGEQTWEVEKIVGSRIEADTYVHYYQVKWAGWSAKHNTWEPKKNLASCHDLIRAFEKTNKHRSHF